MNYLKYMVEEIHTTVVATVDDAELPVTAAIDMMDYNEGGLYFLTAKGKGMPSGLIICHAHQESTPPLYSLNCISESFAFLSQIPCAKPLLQIWMHPLSLYMILQEIFAKLTMYNFCKLITQSVVIRQAQKKHTY